MNRRQKLLFNSGTGLIKQLIVTVCGFILPRYFLLYYGSDINGLVSSITHFLGFISFLEMGIGPVIQANLYKPLADKDDCQISKIVISAECFFRRIAYIFLAYIVVLAIVFPTAINTKFDAIFTVSLLFIIAISTFSQYFFGVTYQLLLNSDQKAYVQTILQIVTVILNTVLCVLLMRLGASIHIVKLVSAAVFILRPLGQMLYVKRHYNLNKKLKLTSEPIKQKWNGFAQHMAAVICGNIDVVLLTFFSTLANVSIYSIYYNVTSGVTNIVLTAATGLESFFGNMIAKSEKETLNRSFAAVEWFVHTVVAIIFTITAITIIPFITVYTRGIDDANYVVPLFGVTLVLAYAFQCLRIPYFRIIKAAGHFKETQNGAFISMMLNIIISVVLVFKFELVGIALGTLIAMLYHTCYFAWYLRKNILERSIGHFIKYMATDAIIFVLTYILTRGLSMATISYLSWIALACKTAGITVVISVIINLLFNRSVILNILKKRCEIGN